MNKLKFIFALLLTAILFSLNQSKAQNTFPTDGNVGINNELPLYPIDVIGKTQSNTCSNFFPLGDPTQVAGVFRGGIAFGSAANRNSGSFISTYNDTNGDQILDSTDSTALGNSSNLAFFATRPAGCGAPQGLPSMVIMSTNDRMGYVGIGTTDPQNKLEVCGTGRFEEVLVDEDWCDFVFDEDYNLPSIDEQIDFIEDKGHMTNFQSEEAMAGEVNLGDVTKRQQQTIEELMLYIGQLNNRIQALESTLDK